MHFGSWLYANDKKMEIKSITRDIHQVVEQSFKPSILNSYYAH
jgi:hypothetical protein